MDPRRYLPRTLPPSLKGLDDLAVDLRWNWNHSADALWNEVDPELWAGTGDPWLILETVSSERLAELAADPGFLARLHEQLTERQRYLIQPTWFAQAHGTDDLGCIAYFSMEFGLSEALPIYSGGLGILAGDHLKTCSDLGVPVVGVGLLYQQGYFRQALGDDGSQLEFFPYNAPTMLPALPVQAPGGGWLYLNLPLPGRDLRLRVWQAQVGRLTLYLLDSNDLANAPRDRSITGELYGGGPRLRLLQEMVLGIGGWRLLKALAMDCTVCHLNEGHAAFAVLERARHFMAQHDVSFFEALTATRAGNIFTTHTPVAAGFDRFPPELIRRYLGGYAGELGITLEQLLALGRAAPDDLFNMAWLAVRGSGRVNGVSRLHGRVSRRIFQPLFPRWPEMGVPVDHVTNGVHMPTWDSAAADALWTEACGKARWLGALETLEQDFRRVSAERLWHFRNASRAHMVASLRARLQRQCATHGGSLKANNECSRLLDPDTLTLGFARRFAAYKRPTLLLHDRARLRRLLEDKARPLQLVIAGKAHPADQLGRSLIQEWVQFTRDPALRGTVVFLEDYDMALAAELVQGVDVWLNTPRRPWEASGTSGMKVLVNGGLNLSELDGWWAEGYQHSVGWALGDGEEHGDDPAWDAHQAEALYRLLEETVVPTFYRRNATGIPEQWIAHMRESLARLTPRFSANRMVREYVEHCYLPAAQELRRRSAEGAALARDLARWRHNLDTHWQQLRFLSVRMDTHGTTHHFVVEIQLGAVLPSEIHVELYADAHPGGAGERHRMSGSGAGPLGERAIYRLSLPAHRPVADYTPRIIPFHAAAAVPLESAHILWAR